jgi:hypothetical protein
VRTDYEVEDDPVPKTLNPTLRVCVRSAEAISEKGPIRSFKGEDEVVVFWSKRSK